MNHMTQTGEALFISLAAFCVVIAVLLLMAGFMHGLGWSVKMFNIFKQKKSTPETAPVSERATANTESPSGMDDQTVAVITAAVSYAMGHSRFRVADIRPASGDRPGWISAKRQTSASGPDMWRRK